MYTILYWFLAVLSYNHYVDWVMVNIGVTVGFVRMGYG